MSVSYRPDVDGLRAVAVISVLFFHAGVPGFAGGFVGVDIFFVISGFLISSIILQEIENNCFSLKNFYQRRIRRIFPALITVLVITSIIAWLVLLPEDLILYAEWLFSAIFMIPNIMSWKVSGDYFSPATSSLPLLHLWSLGIEEQFYLLFPFILLIASRWKIKYSNEILLGLLLALSFIAAVWASLNQPVTGFYWLPTRAWELLLGVAVAWYHRNIYYKPSNLWLNILVLLAVILIVIAIYAPLMVIRVESSLFYQTMACAGTVILIMTGCGKHKTFVHNVLSLPPIVWVGLISYSLYLWHWPLLSFLHYRGAGVPVSWYSTFIVIIASFLLAMLSWKYIEKPFRAGSSTLWSFKKILFWLVSIQIIMLIFSQVIILSKGVPDRFSTVQMKYIEGIKDRSPLHEKCNYGFNTVDSQPIFEDCFIGDKSKLNAQFLIWGDSHAFALGPAFDFMGKEYDVKGIQISYIGAGSFLNIRNNSWTNDQNKKYRAFVDNTLKEIKKRDEVKDVFLMNRSIAYVYGLTDFEMQEGGGLGPKPWSYIGNETVNPSDTFLMGLEHVIDELLDADKRVWVLLPTPEADRNPPQWLVKNIAHNGEVWAGGYPERRKVLLPILYKIQSKYGDRVKLLDPTPFLCRGDNSECLIAANGYSLYFDDDHLSATGARFISAMLRPAFEKLHHNNLVKP